LNYHENSLNFFETYAVRTVSLTIDIRRDPKGEEWLLQRAVTYKSMNGRFDIDIKIVDEKGELVASVYQVNLCVPWKKAVL
jgi:acyl-CoA thioesterase